MTESPIQSPEPDSGAQGGPQGAPKTGWQATNSDTLIIRQMSDEQLADYRETGDLPASVDIRLVEVTDVASHQPDGGAMPFNGFRKK